MALTMLDPRTALIVIDLQKGLMGSPFLHSIDGIIQKTRGLINGFHARNLPVVLVNVAGRAPGRTEVAPRYDGELPAGFTDLIEGLNQQPGDIVVTKRSWGAFATTDLQAQLTSLGVTQVVLAGVATGTGVEASARQAYEAGFNVTLALDAMTDTRAQAHEYSIEHVFPRLGETGTSAEILQLLAERTA